MQLRDQASRAWTCHVIFLQCLRGAGTLYQVTPTGTITLLHSFHGGSADGQYPYSGITIASDGYIYGFADEGGAYSEGVFYRY